MGEQTEWVALGRRDLLGFDREARALIAEMQSYGWRGRISSKGHALLYSPDGKASGSVTRASLRGRSGRNARRHLNRWLNSIGRGMMMRMQRPDTDTLEQSMTTTTASTARSNRSTKKRSGNTTTRPTLTCPEPGCEGRTFVHGGALALHLNHHKSRQLPCSHCDYTTHHPGHLRAHVNQKHPAFAVVPRRKMCPLCERVLALKGMTGHLERHVRNGDVPPGTVLVAQPVPVSMSPAKEEAATAVEPVVPEPVVVVAEVVEVEPEPIVEPTADVVVEASEPPTPPAKPVPWSAPDPTLEAGAQLEAIRALVSAPVVAENARLQEEVENLTELLAISERERGEVQAKLDLTRDALTGEIQARIDILRDALNS